MTLGELAGHQDLAGILTRRPVMTPRLPKVMVEDGRAWLAMARRPGPDAPAQRARPDQQGSGQPS